MGLADINRRANTPRKVEVSAKKVAELVFDKIFPVMQGEPEDAMILSLICAAVLVMRPHLETEKLQSTIMDTTAYISTLLAETEDDGAAN